MRIEGGFKTGVRSGREDGRVRRGNRHRKRGTDGDTLRLRVNLQKIEGGKRHAPATFINRGAGASSSLVRIGGEQRA
jgi:hypothetical protein